MHFLRTLKLIMLLGALTCTVAVSPMQQASTRVGKYITAENFKKAMTGIFTTGGYFAIYFRSFLTDSYRELKRVESFPVADKETEAFVHKVLIEANYPQEMINKTVVKKGMRFEALYEGTRNTIEVPLDKYNLRKTYQKYLGQSQYEFLHELHNDTKKDLQQSESAIAIIQKTLNVPFAKAQSLWEDTQAYYHDFADLPLHDEDISCGSNTLASDDFPSYNLQEYREVLLHEGAHLYYKDTFQMLCAGLISPFMGHIISKKIGKQLNAPLMRSLSAHPRLKTAVLLMQGFAKPFLLMPKLVIGLLPNKVLAKSIEYRADSEAIARISDPELARGGQYFFERDAKKVKNVGRQILKINDDNHPIKEKAFSLIAYSTHPASEKRAKRFEQAAQKLEAQQRQEKE